MEQMPHKDGIYTVGECREWSIEIDKESLFNQASLLSLYETNRGPIETNKDIHTIMDDDKSIFELYLKSALANLIELLARRIEDVNTIEYHNSIIFKLLVSGNHSNHMLLPLKTHCEAFLVRYVLTYWYKKDFNIAGAEKDIVKCLMFRKRSASVQVRNML